eukprot:RCo009946
MTRKVQEDAETDSPEKSEEDSSQPQLAVSREVRFRTARSARHRDPVTLCYVSTASGVAEMVAHLQAAPVIAMDCEGLSLSRRGALRLAQLGTRTHIFVVDVKLLRRNAFPKELVALLERKHPRKLLFDCRSDADALQHQFGVCLGGVLDLQAIEALLRTRDLLVDRGVGESPLRVCGLRDCMKRYAAGVGDAGLKARVGAEMKANPRLWDIRPLPPYLMQYAANDVAALFPIYDHLHAIVQRNHLDGLALSLSAAYADVFRAKPTRSFSRYEHNAFFPVGL